MTLYLKKKPESNFYFNKYNSILILKLNYVFVSIHVNTFDKLRKYATTIYTVELLGLIIPGANSTECCTIDAIYTAPLSALWWIFSPRREASYTRRRAKARITHSRKRDANGSPPPTPSICALMNLLVTSFISFPLLASSWICLGLIAVPLYRGARCKHTHTHTQRDLFRLAAGKYSRAYIARFRGARKTYSGIYSSCSRIYTLFYSRSFIFLPLCVVSTLHQHKQFQHIAK